MSGLKNTVKRIGSFVTGGGYMTAEERSQEKAMKKQMKLDKVYAGAEMPDEELIRRNERRKAAQRRGSRQRNVLTDDGDQL